MQPQTELPRKLGLLDSIAIVVGTMIGSGIFLVPNLVARNLSSPAAILSVWMLTGALSFFGALAYAELGSMIPATGGQYIYLREVYGPLCAFLSSWSLFFTTLTASVAWLAINFANYLSYFVPFSPQVAKLVALGLIAGMTYVNYRGVTAGAAVQKALTGLKLAGLAILIGGAFLAPAHAPAPVPAGGFSFSHYGVAMISGVLCYDGWVALSFVAGEVRNPKRNLPMALGLGVAVVMAVYMVANLAYLRVLTVPEIAAAGRVGAAAAERAIGPAGASIVSLTILLSIAGGTNGWLMTAPRMYFAQARDGLFLRAFAAIHPRYQTPHFAILLFGAWSAFLAVSGTYETLASYAMFSAWAFYGLTAFGVLLLRRRQPRRPRPFAMWGYPVTLLLFLVVALAFVANTFVATPGPALVATLIIASGIPVYYFWKNK
ncbi:MAG TPA: amino acid permease [Bryobacteraceae bacterium]|nr:amino acid permease [Bryobacteraceae bacterium]